MANLQIRLDDDLKAGADALFAGLGMDTPTAVRVFLKQSVMHGGFPFELRVDPYDAYIRKALDEADEEARNPAPRISHEAFMKEVRAYVEELSSPRDASV